MQRTLTSISISVNGEFRRNSQTKICLLMVCVENNLELLGVNMRLIMQQVNNKYPISNCSPPFLSPKRTVLINRDNLFTFYLFLLFCHTTNIMKTVKRKIERMDLTMARRPKGKYEACIN